MLKNANRIILTFLASSLISISLIGQGKKVEAADRLFNNKEYYEALNAYKKAMETVKKKNVKAELTFKQAL